MGITNVFSRKNRVPTLVAAGVTLRDQFNKAFPRRDKASDGWIGNADHQARESDHNADKNNWVHAIDVDANFGPEPGRSNGNNMQRFADELIAYVRKGLDGGRVKYVVYNGKIASGTYKDKFWVWRKHTGDPHTTHVHISFTNKAERNGRPFDLPIFKN